VTSIVSNAPSRAAAPAPTFTAVSGLGGKGPACFLVEAAGRRVMIDLGYGPAAGLMPDVSAIGTVDALVVSHGHRDHVGGFALLPEIGNPPVYATEIVAARLPDPQRVRPLPLCGTTEVLGVPVVTGRNGHAPGGVWLHFGIGDGFLYMGDNSVESILYAHDLPPPAATIVIDASDGDVDVPLSDRIAALDAVLAGGDVLLPVPADGRGPEIALHLARARYPDVRVDMAMGAALVRYAAGNASLRDGVAAELAGLTERVRRIDGPHGIMLATSADGTGGDSALLIRRWESERRPAIVFSGYLTPGTPAERLVKAGRAGGILWNVHPRLADNVALVRAVRARTVVAAFCDPSFLPALSDAMAPARVTMDRHLPL
jgi:Cft2 family RNA processing exonuclease